MRRQNVTLQDVAPNMNSLRASPSTAHAYRPLLGSLSIIQKFFIISFFYLQYKLHRSNTFFFLDQMELL